MEKPEYLSLSAIMEGDSGQPVLLIHDLNASLNDWEALIPLLVNSGHVAHACDLLGHGQSYFPNDPALYYPQLHMAALRQWIDSLSLERAPVLIGHGFGAYLCLRYAYGHPYRVSRLVLINPLMTPDQLKYPARALLLYKPLYRLAMQAMPQWTTRQLLGLRKDSDPALERRVLNEASRASTHNFGILPAAVDLTQGLAELPIRSLFILGMDDPLLDMPRIAELVEDQVDITCQPLPGIGHRPHLEAAEAANRLVNNFLLGI